MRFVKLSLMTIYLSIYLYVCLSVYLSIYLSTFYFQFLAIILCIDLRFGVTLAERERFSVGLM